MSNYNIRPVSGEEEDGITMAYKTIEPDEQYWNVYEHGRYERGSVLAGQSRRSFIDCYESLKEARSAYPKADVIDHSTKVHHNPMPHHAPDWFDPADAGEVWSEEDC